MQEAVQGIFIQMFSQAHIEVQHRIRGPFRFQPFDGKPLEQLLAAFEITVQRIGKQRLAETARTVQKHVSVVGMRHAVDVFRLVDIQIILFPDYRKHLNAIRVFPSFYGFHTHCVYRYTTKVSILSQLRNNPHGRNNLTPSL